MLRIRTAELASVVDAFVVVESEKSHTGERKPILFSEAIRDTTIYWDGYCHTIAIHVGQFPAIFVLLSTFYGHYERLWHNYDIRYRPDPPRLSRCRTAKPIDRRHKNRYLRTNNEIIITE
ncbi:hypothetical protein [Methylosinus sp.]|uniref:hypothetical protein n=1 Tax=Methylosinus sp. TaxID=427 RepID=UPI0039C9E41A